jgi:hypothetical protein
MKSSPTNNDILVAVRKTKDGIEIALLNGKPFIVIPDEIAKALAESIFESLSP